MSSSDVLLQLEKDFNVHEDVVFSCSGPTRTMLSRRGKLFCVAQGDKLHIKLSATRIQDLLKKKTGRRCRPSPDRADWEWITLPSTDPMWPVLAREAHLFAGSLELAGLNQCGRVSTLEP